MVTEYINAHKCASLIGISRAIVGTVTTERIEIVNKTKLLL